VFHVVCRASRNSRDGEVYISPVESLSPLLSSRTLIDPFDLALSSSFPMSHELCLALRFQQSLSRTVWAVHLCVCIVAEFGMFRLKKS